MILTKHLLEEGYAMSTQFNHTIKQPRCKSGILQRKLEQEWQGSFYAVLYSVEMNILKQRQTDK